ncbi:hypothetical protein [Endozoicomonas sp. 8E]|uniref:hypothetical protein n=1 Tax=Endozoicomonas sp. 8E TaxID=3035692 RepID=UPI0029394A9D|nr:hypothetical protein [Endozoicomonas sp. 8E]WOG25797.1 hypothetical protein P6910_14555 [Endozoicomonas sp. 8E]
MSKGFTGFTRSGIPVQPESSANIARQAMSFTSSHPLFIHGNDKGILRDWKQLNIYCREDGVSPLSRKVLYHQLVFLESLSNKNAEEFIALLRQQPPSRTGRHRQRSDDYGTDGFTPEFSGF